MARNKKKFFKAEKYEDPDRLELDRLPSLPDKYKDPEHIWDDVTEKSEQLFILDFNPKKKSGIIQSQAIYLKFPAATLINTFDYPPNSIVSLKNLPKNLPNLKNIWIFTPNFESLQGFPKFLPKLAKLSITNTLISDFSPLPSSIPTLEIIRIGSFSPFVSQITSLKGFPQDLPNLKELEIRNIPIGSLKFLSRSLPSIDKIEISSTNITSLHYLPYDMPNLKKLTLTHNDLTTLKGMPPDLPSLTNLHLRNNYLSNLKHLPKVGHIGCNVNIKNNPIRTLHGLDDRFLKQMLPKAKNFYLCPKGLEIIKDYNPPTYNPKDIIIRAKNFYIKSSHELAQQYVSNPKSLNEGDTERLIWEADLTDRKLIENNVSVKDLILIEISQRLKIPLNSDFSLLK